MATPAPQFARFEDRLPIDVFVVSPNARLREELQEKLGPPRWNVLQAGGGAEALKLLHKHATRMTECCCSIRMLPDLEPDEFHAIVRDRFPNTQVLMLNSQTGQLLVGSASPTPVSAKLVDAVNRKRRRCAAPIPLHRHRKPSRAGRRQVKLRSMIGNSEPMQRT